MDNKQYVLSLPASSLPRAMRGTQCVERPPPPTLSGRVASAGSVSRRAASRLGARAPAPAARAPGGGRARAPRRARSRRRRVSASYGPPASSQRRGRVSGAGAERCAWTPSRRRPAERLGARSSRTASVSRRPQPRRARPARAPGTGPPPPPWWRRPAPRSRARPRPASAAARGPRGPP